MTVHFSGKKTQEEKAAIAKKCNRKYIANLNIKVACWNVRTLLDTNTDKRPERRTALLAKELNRYNIDIVALSETRLPSEGHIAEVKGGYTFFWKGKAEEENRESGVGFAIKTPLVDKLEELPLCVTDRLMSFRLPLQGGRYTTVISVYAPTMSHTEDDILLFYSELRKLLSGIHKDDKILLMGDFNARVGIDYDIWNCLGRNSFGKQNVNGSHLLQLCTEFNLVIGNTIFRQKNKYKGTWMHPRSKHWHMINYIITRKRDLQDLKSVKVMRGAECWTDHRLVRAKLKLKIRSKFQRKSIVPKKLDISKLQLGEIRDSLISGINQLEPLKQENVWEDFKEKIYRTAKDVLGIKKRKHQDWFDENDATIQGLLKKKHRLHEKTLLPNLTTVEKEKADAALRKTKAEAQKRLRDIQNAWWEEKAQALQSASDARDSKTMYQLLKEVYGPQQSSFAPLKSKDGKKIFRTPKEIQERWREHYSELLNRHSEVDESILELIQQFPVKDFLDVAPDQEEVNKAIAQINNGKSPGMDGIPVEVLKYGGDRLREMVFEVISHVWVSSAPQDWRDAILESLFKKGERSECGNFRGISLLSIVGKVFARVLLNRMISSIVDDVLPESQCRFRAQRGTSDMIFSTRQIQEKCIEQNMDLYQCFIDLTKAFDTVNRKMLWKVLKKFGCPDKFIHLIRSLHDDMKATVNSNGSLSEPFAVENGVKQGDVLAPTLFALYFTAVFLVAFKDNTNGVYIRYRTTGKLFNIRRFKANTKVAVALIRDLLYADDCDLVAHTEEDLQDLVTCFDASCKAFGLEINLKKTEIMLQVAPGREYVKPKVFVRDKELKVVKSFTYLGSVLSDDGGMEKEISSRIQKASTAFGNLESRLWSRHGVSLYTKISIYNTSVLSALLYGCETWMIYKRQLKKLERFHQRCLRHILRIKWTTPTPDTEILERCKLMSVEAIITRQSLRWSGHLVRMGETRIPKQLVYGELSLGMRKQSKPKQRYKDTLKANLKKCNISTEGWEELAGDRLKWRKAIKEGVDQFEKCRIQHASYKKSVRKKELVVSPMELKGSMKCELCGRICLSRAGFKSHMRSHEENPTQVKYPEQVGLKCFKCGKIAKSKAGMQSHLRSHARKEEEEVEDNPRRHTRRREDN